MKYNNLLYIGRKKNFSLNKIGLVICKCTCIINYKAMFWRTVLENKNKKSNCGYCIKN